MSAETPENPVNSIVERAKAIILKPKETWPVIEREPASSGDIFTRYVVPLAAIGPIAGLLGGQIFGYGAMGISFRPSISFSISTAILTFVLSLVSLFILAFIADKLAPNFEGQSNSRNAFKLVAYSMTASWLAGIFGIVPSLAFLGLLGLYSFYLFYVGVTPLMKVPAAKATTYTIVTVICAIVLNLVVAGIAGAVGGVFAGPSLMGGSISSNDGSVDLKGVGSIDTAKLEAAAKNLEAAATGQTQSAAAADLQALLPGAIGAYQRTSIESSKAGPASQAEARYEAGDKSFNLKVADIAVAGALAGMAGAFGGVEANKEDADGYERTTTVDGNLVTEKWNKTDSSGSFMTMVGKRYIVEAEGSAGSIDELKAAVASIDAGKLANLGG